MEPERGASATLQPRRAGCRFGSSVAGIGSLLLRCGAVLSALVGTAASRTVACLLVLACAAAPGTVRAQSSADSDVTKLFQSTPEEFVVANAQFVLMHELAHLVIDEKQVPILGPEEMAADYIAAMLLIRPRTVPPEGPDA